MTKQEIMRLVERYTAARVQEELAGTRDSMSAVKRHYEAGRAAWDSLGNEIDALTADLARLRAMETRLVAFVANLEGPPENEMSRQVATAVRAAMEGK